MGLAAALGRGAVALDSSIFIYYIERHPVYVDELREMFRAAEKRHRTLVTSTMTLLEVLVVPYRVADHVLAERYEAILTRNASVQLVGISHAQLRLAAQLRATARLRTPDALQLAAAIASGCSTFLTNDKQIGGVAGLRIVQLEDAVR